MFKVTPLFKVTPGYGTFQNFNCVIKLATTATMLFFQWISMNVVQMFMFGLALECTNKFITVLFHGCLLQPQSIKHAVALHSCCTVLHVSYRPLSFSTCPFW